MEQIPAITIHDDEGNVIGNFNEPICQRLNCKKDLTPVEIENCKVTRMIPLCTECTEWYKQQIQKCAPLFKKIGL